jgi:DNA mismatch repair protein MutL
MPIRVLPAPVADAIAAGEVVERPASVVKELVENSLDAGARRITVEVRGAGRTLIRIADDGAGISPSELPLAFQRHATSKVATLADLEAIGTLGFRGEALSSVSGVADVECRSQGARLRLCGGQTLDQGAAPATPGTVLEVRDLFAQTPARLKFLKSDATETAACVKTVQAYALLNPAIRFELNVDGRFTLRTPGSGPDQLRTALETVLGKQIASEMHDVEGDGVKGIVSQPRVSRGTRDAILLAVNRRPITSRALCFAIEECYLGLLEKGRFPITVLNLEIDPSEIDVNVHPAKREVRFKSERAVFAAIQQAIRGALTGSQPYQIYSVNRSTPRPSLNDLRQIALHEPQPVYRAMSVEPETAKPAASDGWLRPLGQVQDSYLLAESAEGVLLIDQHAAHERLLYDRFLGRLQGRSAASQALLLPETVEVDPVLAAIASDHGERLRSLGFEVEPFGPGMVRILAGPAETPLERLGDALVELLSVLAESRPEDSRERMAASLACHSAVRFGDPLDQAEQRRLLLELEQAPDAITCPHGRPTRLLLAWQDLKRHFRRN